MHGKNFGRVLFHHITLQQQKFPMLGIKHSVPLSNGSVETSSTVGYTHGIISISQPTEQDGHVKFRPAILPSTKHAAH
jgi:hypothetical protein